MSNDRDSSPPSSGSRERRGSVTSAAFSSLFQRSNSTSTGTNGNVAAAARDPRRRLSVTTLGLSGGPPAPASATGAFGGIRRGSISTNNSDSIDENAIEDDETSNRTAPTTPFARRMSFGANAMRSMRAPGGSSPGSTGRPDHPARRSSGGSTRPPISSSATMTAGRRVSAAQASTALPSRSPSDILSATRTDQGFNWSEQLRSRAESSVSGIRPSFSMVSGGGSPPRAGNGFHDRAKSVSDMPAPPQQAAAVKPKQPEPRKPDAMQERILKGDFYMD
ncbi:hypothetical protein BJ166DRAFT_119418 [Pestalotiopsis sp. NC0098]|nr:hypothetical protein BJ166DRAFT_119418 [Pestalotiopsis sp. NC0098]